MSPSPVDLFKVAHTIETPLMLAGLVVLVLFALFRTRISESKANKLFILALVAIILGVIADVSRAYVQPPPRYWINGRVYSPPTDDTSGVPRAIVFLWPHGQGIQTDCTDEHGYFRFEIAPSSLGKKAQVWVVADTYEHSKLMEVELKADTEDLKVGLTPLSKQVALASSQPPASFNDGGNVNGVPSGGGSHAVPGSGAVVNPSCLEGEWHEQLTGRPDQTNTFIWHLSIQNERLHITRQDNLVSGTLARIGQDWKGDLSWGNGDTWHNVILSPSPDCRVISTNQFWYYKRQ